LFLTLVMVSLVVASDPPHDEDCVACHLTHNSLGGGLGSVAGNANLCISCHNSKGTASAKSFADSQQALSWPGLPVGTNAMGTSHRWDVGMVGRIQFLGGAAIRSTGTIKPAGSYTGVYPKTYTLTIATAGNVNGARFNWSATTPGGGSGALVLARANVTLNEGIFVSFSNSVDAVNAFQVGDTWNIYVRSDLRNPTNSAMLTRLDNGRVTCSTCHDAHSQADAPFDPKAPAYAGVGTGTGRHFMRISNNVEQMCVDCHAVRNVTNSVAGSHPVGMVYATNAFYKFTTNLPLEKVTGKIRCLTCHKIHFAPSNDGDLLVMTNATAMCAECHTLADRTSPAVHLSATNGMTLWPGGQYGGTFPQRTNASDRGSCMNCHDPHGWPDTANPTTHYPKLLVDQEENLCYACHDANGPALKNVKDDFAKARRHPIGDSDSLRRAGRSVECSDCHNTHRAMVGSHVYTNTATATRNLISNPLKGVSGVSVNYTGLGNFVAPTTNLYTAIPKSVGATYEYQICFKCHTAYSFGSTPPPGLSPVYSTGTASFTTGSTNVVGASTTWRASMVGMWIVLTSDPTNAYRITVVTSTTSMTVTPAFAGASVAGQAYTIVGGTDVAQEFSPMNRSGHPIMTGLDNYPNSTAVSGKKGLLAAALKVPWNSSIGQQTMMCSDCHNTDGASPAAQGPHGSAAQYMLRGANAANWPNITLANFNTSWCANCHNNAAGSTHTRGDHTGRQCYQCHIVIPHGGKLSRLMADHDTMPGRYAYNGTTNNQYMQSFTKATTGGYGESNCKAQCASEHRNRTPSENW
jgi:predicted CXXCH cytochrome family protein